MKDESSIFDAEPENLDRLFSQILGEPEGEDDSASAATADGILEQPNDQIRRYKLLSVLGEGGMGVVYLAEQRKPIKRQVAVKIVKPGMDSKRVIARFEAERQTLALLDHPNIAHVYDAGTTEAGRPYFVMEYVKGLSITDYCDDHKLTIEDRLGLFVQVCQAVQHAHQKGIIHRDIKPSNILVSAGGDKVIPKIIDFGVAKAIAQPLTERTLTTEGSQLLGTPEYMSPEQADMIVEDIDTRSDIYSLGVLLYVLLTGVMPFDSTTFREGGIERVRQVIRETDPKTPSTRLSSLGKEAKKIAQNRRTKTATLAMKLHKELEWIPLKAMRKDRAERYRSASEFADDIGNYLKGNPLIAGPLSTTYRIKKFVRRNQALVVGIATVFVVLVAGIIVSTLFAIHAEHALNRETIARAEAQVITDFLTQDVLGSVDKIMGREATVADILNAASKNLGNRFEDQPFIEASICRELSSIYGGLGDHRSATPYLERAYQILQKQLGEHHDLTALAKNNLALKCDRAGEYNRAASLLEELVEARLRESPEDTDLLPWYKCNLAGIYYRQGRYKEAERLILQTWETDTEWWKPTWDHEWKGYQSLLATIYVHQGRYKEAEPLFTEILKKAKDDSKWVKNRGMSELGRLYVALKRYDEAEDFYSKAIEIGRHELPGENHPTVLQLINDFAVLRRKQKLYEDAERLFNEALACRHDKLGDDHPETLETKAV